MKYLYYIFFPNGFSPAVMKEHKIKSGIDTFAMIDSSEAGALKQCEKYQSSGTIVGTYKLSGGW
jgi:hypothetical protein